ncbi:tRNA (guanosine(37)-N1)-methyltransferase TrmD [Candidatus Uhrbacteria bacterium]|nr:tRNA (guanosine(37)-N1)-methyltransferase TrmD [Candidatus Uhrbacteria bacterium]
MRFDIITIFPGMFGGYFGESIIKRAAKSGLLDIRVHDLRRWAQGKHRKTDDKPFGGGPGMVMSVEPFYRAVTYLKRLAARNIPVAASPAVPRRTSPRSGDTQLRSGCPASERPKPQPKIRVILTSPKGRTFTHRDAVRLSKYDRVIFLCGRYEGVDERVAKKLADEELSIGNYVLTGGELPAMVMVDAISRHIPGVLGKAESLKEESHAEEGVTEYPQYTRPEIFRTKDGEKWPVPPVLLSGDHKRIAEWRKGKAGKN